MILTRHAGFLIVLTGILSLGGCKTLNDDLNRGYADIMSLFREPGTVQMAETTEQAEDIEFSLNTSAEKPSSEPVMTVIPGIKPDAPRTETKSAEVVSPPQPEIKTTQKNPCPPVKIVSDLNQVHQFMDMDKPRDKEKISSIRMVSVQNSCSTVSGNVIVDMTIAFSGDLGPRARREAGDKPSLAYPYFVAITNPQGAIVSKEVFAVSLSFDKGVEQKNYIEQIRQVIPLQGGQVQGSRILIGFQLNNQELAYNRSHGSLMPVSQIEPAAGN